MTESASMTDSHSVTLTRAYELIEEGKSEEARALIEPIIEAEPSNADAWWILAHAVSDPTKARQALQNVLKLNPSYPGANELLSILNEQYPPETPGMVSPPVPKVVAPPPVSAVDEPDFVAPAASAPVVIVQESNESGLSPVLMGAAVAAVVLVLTLLLLALIQGGNPPEIASVITPDPTSAAADSQAAATEETSENGQSATLDPASIATLDLSGAATEDPSIGTSGQVATLDPAMIVPLNVTADAAAATEEVDPNVFGTPTLDPSASGEVGVPTAESVPSQEVLPTVEQPMVDPTQSAETSASATADYSNIVNALAAYNPPENSVSEEETTLGKTLIASYCTAAGVDMRTTLPNVMQILAVETDALDPSFAAVGTRVLDCATGETLRLIVVARADATAMASGTRTQAEFESVWFSL
jgi:hypothetical protein